MKKHITTVALLTLLAAPVQAEQAAAPAGAQTLTVGTDAQCDHASIAAALAAIPSGSTDPFHLRITRQQAWQETLNINNRHNVTLWGGYNNCTDAAAAVPTGAHSVITGSGTTTAPLALISNAQNLSFVRMDFVDGGIAGALWIGVGSFVTVNDARIADNFNNSGGGGIQLSGGSRLDLSKSVLENNGAPIGGGLHCLGTGSVVFMHTTRVAHNFTTQVTGRGGGLAAESGCLMHVFAFNNPINAPTVIHDNIAHMQGGGIYAATGAQVRINAITAESPGQVRLRNNRVENFINPSQPGAGAGIYATGVGSEVTGVRVVLDGNTIDENMGFVGGAAIAVHDGAFFSLRAGGLNNVCFDPDSDDRSCNQIKNNVTLSGDAAVIKITGGAAAEIYQTSVFANQTSTPTNQLASVLDGDLVMQGDLIFDNGRVPNPPQIQVPTRLIRVAPNGTFHGDFLTFTDNRLWGGRVIQASSSPQINLTRSIVAEDPNEAVFLDASVQPSTTLFRCLLVHENSSFTGSQIVLGAPLWQSTWPRHLRSDSPGVNLCTHVVTDLLPEHDIDGQERGPCPVACLPQRFDAGADEFRGEDVIFRNGFALIL